MDKVKYCECKNCASVYIDDDEWGHWMVCCNCNKPIEGTYVYYNHYDGEDHEIE